MPRGRPRKINPEPNPAKAVRFTFRVEENTVTTFKTIARVKKLAIEELGESAIKDVIEKYKSLLDNDGAK